MDQQVVALGHLEPLALVPSETGCGDIAFDHLRNIDSGAVVGTDIQIAVDQRGDAMPGGDQPRADLAADQPGGPRHQYSHQQQAAGVSGTEPSSAPKGTATPQSGNTP